MPALHAVRPAPQARRTRPPADPEPAGIAPLVERMLGAAMQRFEAEADAARTEAEAVVARATERSSELLLSVSSLRTMLHAAPGGRLVELAGPQEGAASAIGAWSPSMPGTDRPVTAVGVEDSTQLHTLFWGDDTNRPVRRRLHRWMQRPAT
jgi:hypothetical protein